MVCPQSYFDGTHLILMFHECLHDQLVGKVFDLATVFTLTHAAQGVRHLLFETRAREGAVSKQHPFCSLVGEGQAWLTFIVFRIWDLLQFRPALSFWPRVSAIAAYSRSVGSPPSRWPGRVMVVEFVFSSQGEEESAEKSPVVSGYISSDARKAKLVGNDVCLPRG